MKVTRSLYSLFEANPFDTAQNYCEDLEDGGCEACNAGARRSSFALWGVIMVLLAFSVAFDKSFPFYQFAHPQDLRFHYPYLKETFPSWICFFVGGIVPLALLVVPAVLATAQVAIVANAQRSSLLVSTKPRALNEEIPEQDTTSDEAPPSLARSRSVVPHSSSTPPISPTATPSFSYSLVSLLKAFLSVGFVSLTGVLSSPSGALGLCLSLALSTCIVTVIKTYVGRPRPNAIALSMYKYDKQARASSSSARATAVKKRQALVDCVTQMRCGVEHAPDTANSDLFAFSSPIPLAQTSPALLTRALAVESPQIADATAPSPLAYTAAPSLAPHLINEALRSFPSGHASFAFSGFLFLALVLFRRYKELMKKLTGFHNRHAHAMAGSVYGNSGDLSYFYPPHTSSANTNTSSTSLPSLSLSPPRSIPALTLTPPSSPPKSIFAVSIAACLAPFFPIPSSSPPFWTPTCSSAYIPCPDGLPSSPSAPLPSANTIYSPKSPSTHLFTRHIPLPKEILPLPLAIGVYIVAPVLIASVVAASRVVDYWHHPDDVLAGSVLGGLCAGLAYMAVNFNENGK